MSELFIKLRPEVAAFAEAMERQLRKNERKGGWKNCSLGYLIDRYGHEHAEFAVEVLKGDKRVLLAEAADTANFLMMICDVRGALGGAEEVNDGRGTDACETN